MTRTRNKGEAELYCNEDGIDKEQEKGHNHQVQCTNKGCEIWTDVWIPKKIPRNFLTRPFFCGFCTAAKFEATEIAMREEAQSTRETYAEITKNQELVRAPQYNARENIAISAYSLESEQKERLKKAKNVVVFGTKPTDTTQDVELVKKIQSKLELDVPFKCKRIGSTNSDGKQLLLINYENEEHQKTILKKAKFLRGDENFGHIFIRPDLTKNEQELLKKLVIELKEKREKERDKKFFISNGRIIEMRK